MFSLLKICAASKQKCCTRGNKKLFLETIQAVLQRYTPFAKIHLECFTLLSPAMGLEDWMLLGLELGGEGLRNV